MLPWVLCSKEEPFLTLKFRELHWLTGNKLPWLSIHPVDSPRECVLGVVPLRGPAQELLCFTYSACSTVTESEEQTQVTGKKAGLENPSFVLGCCLIPLVWCANSPVYDNPNWKTHLKCSNSWDTQREPIRLCPIWKQQFWSDCACWFLLLLRVYLNAMVGTACFGWQRHAPDWGGDFTCFWPKSCSWFHRCVYHWSGYVCYCVIYKNWLVQKLHEGWCGCGMSWTRSWFSLKWFWFYLCSFFLCICCFVDLLISKLMETMILVLYSPDISLCRAALWDTHICQKPYSWKGNPMWAFMEKSSVRCHMKGKKGPDGKHGNTSGREVSF